MAHIPHAIFIGRSIGSIGGIGGIGRLNVILPMQQTCIEMKLLTISKVHQFTSIYINLHQSENGRVALRTDLLNRTFKLTAKIIFIEQTTHQMLNLSLQVSKQPRRQL